MRILERYAEVLALQRKIYHSFGIEMTDSFFSIFNPFVPVCKIPQPFPKPDTRRLEREVRNLEAGGRTPSSLAKSFSEVINELSRRRRWIDDLLIDAGEGKCSEKELAEHCYRFVTGEQHFVPDLLSVVITPVSIHFICGDDETAAMLYLSSARAEKRARNEHTGALTPEEIRKNTNYRGVALKQIARAHGTNMVSAGKDESLQEKFKTFRHELDHLLFSLRDTIVLAQEKIIRDRHRALIYADLHRLATTEDPPERESLTKTIIKSCAALYYYEKIGRKPAGAHRVADEFISQFLDADAEQAAYALASAHYQKNGFPNDITAECDAFTRELLRKGVVHIPPDLEHSLQNAQFANLVLGIRAKQIQNAVAACDLLKTAGFNKHETADILRTLPLSRWQAFARKHGKALYRMRPTNDSLQQWAPTPPPTLDF